MISTSISSNSITVVVIDEFGNKVYTLNRSHPNYDAVVEAVRNNDEVSIHKLCNISKTIETFAEGKVRVENGHVYYGTLLLDGVIVDRILGFIQEKLPVTPLLKFINKLYENPSARAISELYKFLEHKNMPITPEGNFLAYKGVQTDYFSKTAGNIEVILGKVVNGKIFNGVGETIVVKRNQVCDDKNVGCSKGLHAGSVKYATEFGYGGKVVIVEINPADVVSIPTDCECQKLRACAYKVVGEFEAPLNNNYCDSYCDDEDEDETSVDEIYDDAFTDGYDAGWDDGVSGNGFDNTINTTELKKENPNIDADLDYPELLAVWKEGYQVGYDDGVKDRE